MENGQPELLRELFSAPPNITAGRIAHDGLRQMKNMGICTATGVSRAAIQGGLDPEQAFCMSDLYIQKLELMRDVSNIERLMQEMMLDFAEQVEKMIHPSGSESQLYRMCAQYVSQNIFTSIRAEQIANALGYTRAYLCTRFKQEAGISLTRYIQKEKIAEAKRLLQFTDQNLGEIASVLNFSSQSHFQTVFREITGETPMAYRKRTKIIR
ncbi:helix-turn-helix transcriptional regulator [bacterium]|nr:helix-turn-helix transcriptional regulator [bacterium]